jgi:hypothetical protein
MDAKQQEEFAKNLNEVVVYLLNNKQYWKANFVQTLGQTYLVNNVIEEADRRSTGTLNEIQRTTHDYLGHTQGGGR